MIKGEGSLVQAWTGP